MAKTANRDAGDEGDFHHRTRAEAESAVHSRRLAGLLVALLLFLSGAYGIFVWQSDRAALSAVSLTQFMEP